MAVESRALAPRFAERDIRAHRVAEHQRRLQHHRDIVAQRIERELSAFVPVDLDRALLRFVEAHQQTRHRGLAGAARPDDRDRLAGRGA